MINSHNRPTLSGRLLLAILGLVMLVFGLTAFSNYQLVAKTAHRQLDSKADEQLANLSQSLELPLWALDKTLIEAICGSYLHNDLIVSIRVTEANGKSDLFYAQKDVTGKTVQRNAIIIYKGEQLGRVSLTFSSNLLQQQLRDLLRYSIGTALLMMTVLSLLTGIMLRSLLKKPILSLQQGITRLAGGDYSAELHAEVSELEPIAAAFTAMARQIEVREQELQRIADASWEAILIQDQGVLLHANEQFFELFGYQPHELTGQPYLERIIAAKSLDPLLARIRTDNLEPFETLARSADGTEFPIEVRARLLQQQGKTLRMVAIRDLRERKRVEEMLIQSEKMVSVGGLAAGMAHEINNPLAGILQNIQVISNRLNPELEKNIRVAEAAGTDMARVNAYLHDRGLLSMLENIRMSGQRAAKIVENILSFSRKSKTQLQPVEMPRLLEESLALAESDYDLSKKFDFRKIELTRQIEPGLPLVFCEPSQIQQVLLNLLKNGAHAMSEADIRNPRFTLRLSKEDDWLRIEVEDNGPGMDEEISRRIFEPFFTTKKVGEGTGLGLSVSYFIITQTHKGEMRVKSSQDGTVFIIRIPLQLNAHRVAAAPRPDEVHTHPEIDAAAIQPTLEKP